MHFPLENIPHAFVKYHWRLNKLALEILSPTEQNQLYQLFLLYNSTATEVNRSCMYLNALLQLFTDANLLAMGEEVQESSQRLLTLAYVKHAFAAAALGALKMHYDRDGIPALPFPQFCGLLLHCAKVMYPFLTEHDALRRISYRCFKIFKFDDCTMPNHVTSYETFSIHKKHLTELWAAPFGEVKQKILGCVGRKQNWKDVDRIEDDQDKYTDTFTVEEVQFLSNRFETFDVAGTGRIHRLEIIPYISGVLSVLNIDSGRIEELYQKVLSLIEMNSEHDHTGHSLFDSGDSVTFRELMIALIETRNPTKALGDMKSRQSRHFSLTTSVSLENSDQNLSVLPPIHSTDKDLDPTKVIHPKASDAAGMSTSIMANETDSVGDGVAESSVSPIKGCRTKARDEDEFTPCSKLGTIGCAEVTILGENIVSFGLHAARPSKVEKSSPVTLSITSKNQNSNERIVLPRTNVKRDSKQIRVEITKGDIKLGKVLFIDFVLFPKAIQLFQTHGCYFKKLCSDYSADHTWNGFLGVDPNTWNRCLFHTVSAPKTSTLTALLQTLMKIIVTHQREGYDYRTPQEKSEFTNQLVLLQKSSESTKNNQRQTKHEQIKPKLRHETLPDKECSPLTIKLRREKTTALISLSRSSTRFPTNGSLDFSCTTAGSSNYMVDYSWISALSRSAQLPNATHHQRPKTSAL